MEQEDKLCDEVKKVWEFTYLGDRVSAGGGCEAAVTVCDWAVHKSYIRPAILYGSEAWCLIESQMGILQRTERCMVRVMCGVQHKDRKRSINLMLDLIKSIDQLAMANSVCWYGHVLRRTLDCVHEGQR